MMRYFTRSICVLAVALALLGCRRQESAEQSQKVLRPAAAAESYPKGGFYPAQAESLGKLVDDLLAKAHPQSLNGIRALVCPHAGYEYSGQTAAIAYKLLEGSKIRTVIVLGPSHTAEFKGAALPDAVAFETPLGRIPISHKAAELGKLKPFAVNPQCKVYRPNQWKLDPRELPAFGEETPHTWEHSVEVQFPFLQRVLGDFEVVPVVCGEMDPKAAAEALVQVLDDDTLLVASSDLTHGLSYESACARDRDILKAVSGADIKWMEVEHSSLQGAAGALMPCGTVPVLTLMHVARLKGWTAQQLDYRNSGDVAGRSSRIVGYGAVAFCQSGSAPAGPPSAAASPARFSAVERKCLLEWARKSVTAAINGQELPLPASDGFAPQLKDLHACFVTLTNHGRLRGCMGSTEPQKALYHAVIHHARQAAVEDYRFQSDPITAGEVKDLKIEVSVLTDPEPLKYDSPAGLLAQLRPGIDGVVLIVGRNGAVYLPQVWDEIPDKIEFLSQLSQKAGLPSNAWRHSDAIVRVFQVEAFKEGE